MRHPRSLPFLVLLVLGLGATTAEARHHPHPRPTTHTLATQAPETSGGARILQFAPVAPPEAITPGACFVEPEAGIRPVIGALESAKQSIDLVVYLLSDDRVVAALRRAKERGVAVRVLLEEHPYGGSAGNRASFSKLDRLGIPTRYTPARFRFTHQKTFVLDRRQAVITTANFTRSAFSKNREYGYLDGDAAEIREIEAMFEADWADRPFLPRAPRLVVSPSNARAKLLELIRSATSTLEIQDETCSDPEILQAIAERQHAGVQVTVQVAEARDLRTLTSAGIPARRMVRHYLHAKTIVVDRTRAYLGSENLTTNSLDHNRELGILLAEPAVVGTLAATVAADWNEPPR